MNKEHDCLIIGGGLAGLAAAISLARAGKEVALFEKKTYPHHKVCGEYISMEAWPYLQWLGIDPVALQLPRISELHLSDCNGRELHTPLDIGGYGISRFLLDHLLCEEARQLGVTVYENCPVQEVITEGACFRVLTTQDSFVGNAVIGAYGKRSNLDVKAARPFLRERSSYIAVKYHLQSDMPDHAIALHNFPGGYCGISRVENGITCLCYLTTASHLKKAGTIARMEQQVLHSHPTLKRYLTESTRLYEAPVTISQVSFAPREQQVAGMLLAGDAAGLITPLCGNGMSMALQSGKMLSGLVLQYLEKQLTQLQLHQEYQAAWKAAFSRRLWAGRHLQSLFGRPALTNATIAALRKLPGLTGYLVRQTHGRPF